MSPGRRRDPDPRRHRRHAQQPRSALLLSRRARLPGLMRTTDGNYGGLGLTVTMEDGAVKVIAASRDTPADRAGIKLGDFITHIDGRLFYGGTLDEAVERMRGAPGTSVNLTVVRPGRDRPFDVKHHPGHHRHSGGAFRGARPGLHPHRHHLQPQHDRTHQRAMADIERELGGPPPATSSTSAPTRAACSTRRSACPTCSSSAARWCRSAAAAAPTSSAIMPGPATPRTACRSSSWSMPAAPRPRRSSPPRSRIIAARW